ncbi:YecA family protein [Clostridium sp. WILCCON 0269]|uniref:YecA family protein n=1 Tax=Candidatus Clostridium eludens TaxID=3381663 RepID=A0ABW8SFI7_9CLOT
MWKKIFRNSQSLNYRKKYKCPVCKEYSLYIIHDKACECRNGCDIDNLNIANIMIENDFCGYYTSQEIKENFWIDDEECNKILKKITVNNTLSLLTYDEKQTIETFFQRTSQLDERLDDIMANYLNNNTLKEVTNITPFGYLINLIEDTHFFVNMCCKDTILLNYGIELATKHFYSGRFFYNNSVEHLFEVNERIFVILGILYRYSFESNLSLNKTFKIEKFLKKNSDYKNSQYKIIFERLKSNNLYNELKSIRQSNDHDLSYYSKVINEDIQAHGNESFEYWNRDGNKVDKDIYLPQIKNIIFCLNEFYNLLDQIIIQVSNGKEINQILTFPMIEKFLKFDDKITFRKYDSEDLQKLQMYKNDLFLKLSDYKSNLIIDIFFRMDEAVHCIVDVYNIAGNSFYKYWSNIGIMQLDSLIDEQYLLYSALFRLYSCYDKLSRYIAKNNVKYTDIKYFEEFQTKLDNGIIINKIKSILNDENYKLLFQLRNDIYHNLRAGCLYGDNGINYYNMVLLKTVFENTTIIYEFINFLNPNKKVKIGRNDLCPCGSGKKYKKCCGNNL